jgi:hypothetical protein
MLMFHISTKLEHGADWVCCFRNRYIDMTPTMTDDDNRHAHDIETMHYIFFILLRDTLERQLEYNL